MCVAVPVLVESIGDSSGRARPAIASTPDGQHVRIDLLLVPGVTVGDYVLAHSGYAVSAISSSEAARTLELMEDALEL